MKGYLPSISASFQEPRATRSSSLYCNLNTMGPFTDIFSGLMLPFCISIVVIVLESPPAIIFQVSNCKVVIL